MVEIYQKISGIYQKIAKSLKMERNTTHVSPVIHSQAAAWGHDRVIEYERE